MPIGSDEVVPTKSHLNPDTNSYSYRPSNPPPPHPPPHHHPEKKPRIHYPYHTYHPASSLEIHPNEISHSPASRPGNNAADASDEVHHIHVFEKGFFEKEKRMRGKDVKHHGSWTPVLRSYRFGGSGEGGHGSASMERAAAEEAAQRGRRHRPPPPSRRRPVQKSSKRPYHNVQEEIDDHHHENDQLRNRTPHSHSHPTHPSSSHHHGRRHRS